MQIYTVCSKLECGKYMQVCIIYFLCLFAGSRKHLLKNNKILYKKSAENLYFSALLYYKLPIKLVYFIVSSSYSVLPKPIFSA